MNVSRDLHRSLMYRLLASAFLYPDTDIGIEICSESFVRTLHRPAVALGSPQVMERVEQLQGAVDATREATLSLASEYVALFTRNVLCSPYGSRYLVRDVLARPRVLEEVMGYYTAFGVEVDRAQPDLPDHVGTELEFVGYLLAKEVYAYEAGWVERAAICRDARRRFLGEHLLHWFPAFRDQLHVQARLPFYPAVADLTLAVLEEDARALGSLQYGLVRSSRLVQAVSVEGESDDNESTFDCGIISG